jgi:hypothetical protein
MESHPVLIENIAATQQQTSPALIRGIIGSGHFLTSSDVAAAVRVPWLFMLAWATGIFVNYLASASVAELGTMFPEASLGIHQPKTKNGDTVRSVIVRYESELDSGDRGNSRSQLRAGVENSHRSRQFQSRIASCAHLYGDFCSSQAK